MGTGLVYVCRHCGREFQAYLGVGMMYPQVRQQAMNDARSGELGEKAKRFFAEHPDATINAQNVIAQCEDCGNYEMVMDMTMHAAKDGQDLQEPYDHRCKQCGGSMHILAAETPGKLTCPDCGDDMVVKDFIMWD